MSPLFRMPHASDGPRDAANDPLVDRLAADVRAYVDRRPGVDVTSRVMARVAASEATRPRRWRLRAHAAAWGRLVWTPRVVHIRPAYGVAALAVVVLAASAPTEPQLPLPKTGLVSAADTRTMPPAAAAVIAPPAAQHVRVDATPAAPARILVQFRLPLAGAQAVRLAGSFTGWEQSHALQETAPGIWSATVALEPGVHDYLFVVDGRTWVPDPSAPRVSDGFGGVNSRLALMAPEAGAL